MTRIVAVAAEDADRLLRSSGDLPEEDRTFIKEGVAAPATVQAWAAGDHRAHRWIAVDGDAVHGYVAVLPLTGWSDHAAEVRLVVAPDARGGGPELSGEALLPDHIRDCGGQLRLMVLAHPVRETWSGTETVFGSDALE